MAKSKNEQDGRSSNMDAGKMTMSGSYSSTKRKKTREPRLPVVEATADRLPRFTEVVHTDNLLATLKNMMASGGGVAAGEDDVGLFDLSPREWAEHLRARSSEVLASTYRPDPTRVVTIPKASGGTRPLDIPSVLDRVLAVAVNTAISKYIDAQFLPSSCGFRPNLSHWNTLAMIKIVAEATQSFHLVVDDVRQAFPSVRIDPMLEDCRRMIPDPGIINFITAVVRGHDGTNLEKKIPQGNPISPTLLNIHLHHRHDLPCQGEDYILLWVRYADNLVYLVRSMLDGQRALDHSRYLLNEVGLDLKGKGGGLVDLRENSLVVCDTDADPEALTLLGFCVHAKNGTIFFNIPAKSWKTLEDRLTEAHQEKDPTTHAKSTLLGCIQSCGPAIENQAEPCLSLILERIRKTGFRHLLSEETIRGHLRRGLERWRSLLGEERTRTRI